MRFIIAQWKDMYNQVFLTELYPEDQDTDELFDYFVYRKALYLPTAISSRDYCRLSFTDGTQCTLNYIGVQSIPTKKINMIEMTSNEEENRSD